MERYTELEYVAKYHEDELVRKAAVAKMVEEIKTHSHRLGIFIYYMNDGGFSEEVRVLLGKEAVKICVEDGIYNRDDKNIKSIIAGTQVPESVKEFAEENLDAAARKRIKVLLERELNQFYDLLDQYHSLIGLHKEEGISAEVREEAKTAAGDRIMESIDVLADEGWPWSLIKIKNDPKLRWIHPEIAKRAAGLIDKAAARLVEAIGEDYLKKDYIAMAMLQNLSDIIESNEISEDVKDKAREIIGPVGERAIEEIPLGRGSGVNDQLLNIVCMPEVPFHLKFNAARWVAGFLKNDASDDDPRRRSWAIEILEMLATDETKPEVMGDAAGEQLARVFRERGDFGALAAMIQDTYTIVIETKDGQEEHKTVKFTEPAKTAAREDIDYAVRLALDGIKSEPKGHLFEDERERKERRDIKNLACLTKNTYVSEKYRKEAKELLRAKMAGFTEGLDDEIKQLKKEHAAKVRATFGSKISAPAPERRPNINSRRRLFVKG